MFLKLHDLEPFIFADLRPRSVDFSDGGATDVPILGPME